MMYFTEEHEWARLDGDTATCGITDHAQKALGDIVYVELPAVGKKFKKGEQIAVVESSKAASEVYAPMGGEVLEVNTELEADPGCVNRSPQEDGWFFKLKMAKDHGPSLMNEQEYDDFIKSLTQD